MFLFLPGCHRHRVLVRIAVRAGLVTGVDIIVTESGKVSIECPGMNQVAGTPCRRKRASTRRVPTSP
jgi:hypothetical protein